MLNSLRGGIKSLPVKILLGALIASFAAWGVGDPIRSGLGNSAAKVGDKRISGQELTAQFNRIFRDYQAQSQGALDQNTAIRGGLHRQALDGLIAQAVWAEYFEDIGVRGTDLQVREAIRSNPSFQGPNGVFDQIGFEQVLANNNITEDWLVEVTRGDLARQQFFDSVNANESIPGDIAKRFYEFRKQERTAKLVTLRASAINDIAPADEETLRAFHSENGTRFMSPEYRGINLAVIDVERFRDGPEIAEDEIAARYELRIAEFTSPELRNVLSAVLPDNAAAEDLFSRAQNGESFEAVATELTGLAVSDLDQGDLAFEDVAQDYGDVAAFEVFDIGEGDVSVPIETSFGWTVFQVASVTTGVSKSLDEVRQQIIDDLREEAALDRLYDFTDTIQDGLASGMTFSDLAEQHALQTASVAAVSRTGLTPDESLVETEPSLQPYLASAFLQSPDDEIFLQEGGADNSFYLLEVTDVIESDVIPFEDVQEDVRTSWLLEARLSAAEESAAQLVARLNAGARMEDIASEQNLDVITSPQIRRDEIGFSQEIAAGVAQAIFDLREDQATMVRAADGDGFIVTQLASVSDGEAVEGEEAYRALQAQLSREITNDLLEVYFRGVRDDLGVEINEPLLDTLFVIQDGS